MANRNPTLDFDANADIEDQAGLMVEARSHLRLPKTIRCMLAYRCSPQP